MAPESERALNESNRTQFESCSEVVERLATLLKVCVGAGYDPTPGVEKCVLSINESRFRIHAGAILHSWRERRVQELEEALRPFAKFVDQIERDESDDMHAKFFHVRFGDVRKAAKVLESAEWREQIRKGAKHE